MEILSKSEKDTFNLGFKISSKLKGGELILLYGDLGCGKTVFTKGLAKGLLVADEITSPTYVFLRSYKGGKFTLYHFDFYRADKPYDLERIDIEDLIEDEKGIFVVEWPEFFPTGIFKKQLKLEFDNRGENERLIKITADSGIL